MRYFHFALIAITLSGCVNAPPDRTFDSKAPQPNPTPGQTRFVSADYTGALADERFAGGGDEGAPSADSDARAVEEGDIYRVIGARVLIANVNTYRGLQLIDVADPENPVIVGGARFSGEPVEMYTVRDEVFALLNGCRGYWGADDLARPRAHEGGLLVVANVADPTAPKIVQQLPVKGTIRTSWLVRRGEQTALYVVAKEGPKTYVQSFVSAANGMLAARSRIEFAGNVIDVHATATRLFVASTEGDGPRLYSRIAIIDISDPEGALVEGGSVTTAGYVESEVSIDLDADVLRVVSISTSGASQRTNHIETFDVSDIDAPRALDAETFGNGEGLYRTLFRGSKAFFVTYEVTDPLYAFEFSPDGTITQRAEFAVSGWNDFFEPAFDDARLLGVGVDDRAGSALDVSLYDTTNLQNREPLLDRKSIDLAGSWSEANWDHRAFTVIEGATSISAADGTEETGLVLLPFTGWDEEGYRSGVQLVSFSMTTVTRRGTMLQDSAVRRSFHVDRGEHVANLSDVELSLYDIEDPDEPSDLGHVELAPNYTDSFVIDDHLVRRRDRMDYYWWWYDAASRVSGIPTDFLEVVPLGSDVEHAPASATLEIPAGSRLYRVGTSIVGLRWTWAYTTSDADRRNAWETELTVYDFADPTAPRIAGTLTTRDLPLPYGFGAYPEMPTVDGDVPQVQARTRFYTPYGRVADGIRIVGNALVLPESIGERALQGVETVTYRTPAQSDDHWKACWTPTGPAGCTYATGAIECRTLERANGTATEETCTGAFYQCAQDASGTTDCAEIDPSSVKSVGDTWKRERYRYWKHYDLHIVDVSDPMAPILGRTVSMSAHEEAQAILVRDAQLFVSFRIPVNVADAERGFVRYFFRAIDLSDPQDPVAGASVNVPGVLVEVDDGLLVTRDWLWGENIAETALHRLHWVGDIARLSASHRFADEYVGEVISDGDGHLLATHRAASWNVWGLDGDADEPEVVVSPALVPNNDIVRLTTLDLERGGLYPAASVEIDASAALKDATAGRGLFSVPGGLLIYNVDDPAAPSAQAFFALGRWPHNFERSGRDLLFAAGRHGIYRFDRDEFNLLQR